MSYKMGNLPTHDELEYLYPEPETDRLPSAHLQLSYRGEYSRTQIA